MDKMAHPLIWYTPVPFEYLLTTYSLWWESNEKIICKKNVDIQKDDYRMTLNDDFSH